MSVVFKNQFQNDDSKNADMKATKFSLAAVLALGSVMALAPLARAEDKKEDDAKPKAPQRERAARPQDRFKELNLTDEQKPKFEAAMKEQNEKMRELRQDTTLSAEERRTKLRELRENSTANIKKILDAEQFEKWQKMQQAGVRARGPRAGRPPGEKPPADQKLDNK